MDLPCFLSFTPEQSGYWLQKLEDEKTRIEGLKNLGKFKEPAVVDAVINLLEQKGDWQPDAAYTLGQLGDTRAIPNLIAAIDYAGAPGKSARSRRINKTNINAARALAMLKTDAALDPIVRLTNSSDQNTTQAAIESLGNLGNPGAVKPLAEFASTASHPFIRKTAVIALGKLGSAEAVAPLIVALYQELPGVSFYLEARQALIEVGPAAIPALLETLDRKNKAVEAVRLPDGQPIAEGAIEEADRSTYYFQLGLGTNNPTTGKNFIGFASEGVDPQVNELRTLKFELEALEDVQIDKCVTRQGFFDIKQ